MKIRVSQHFRDVETILFFMYDRYCHSNTITYTNMYNELDYRISKKIFISCLICVSTFGTLS